MIHLYRVLTNFLYPFLIILIYIRKFIKKEHHSRFKEKIFRRNFNINKNPKLRLIWFHAASIGELKSILPLIKHLNKNEKKIEILITTITISSSNLAKKELNKFQNIHHRFFPLDIKFLINFFLDLWKPDAILLVDSEIWPNLIMEAKKRNISLALINGRITEKTFKRWQLIRDFGRKIFNSFDLCISSNQETSNFLRELNAKNIVNLGNLKLINSINLDQIKNINEEVFIKKRLWLAASTHKGEEDFCLKTHLELKKKTKNILTAIAPRHIIRVNEIKKLCDKYNLTSQILNEGDYILDNKEIIIINSFGILTSYFKFSKSVFIGKSTIKKLENDGGQNPIDAAYCGCKIYHGEYVYNFEEIYKILQRNNISMQINTPAELAKNIALDLNRNDKEKNKTIIEMENLNKETSKNYLNQINKFLNNEI